MVENEVSSKTFVVASTPVFAFDVPFMAAANIHCYIYTEEDKTERELAPEEFSVEVKTDYSSGANVTLLGTLIPGAKLTISRELGITQDVNLPLNGKLPSTSLERQLDKIIMICQQLRALTARCFAFPRGMADYDIDEFYNNVVDVKTGISGWIAAAEAARDQAAWSAQSAAGSAQSAAGSAQSAATAATAAVATHDSSAAAHQDIRDAITGAQVPTGTVFSYAAPGAIPAGFLLCDGSTVSRTIYSGLFAVIGTAYGEGDGSTTFKLPDFRGMFLRGYKVDVSEGIGTEQNESLPKICGQIGRVNGRTDIEQDSGAFWRDGASNDSWAGVDGRLSHTVHFDASRYDPIYSGSHVTPKNYAVQFIIKY